MPQLGIEPRTQGFSVPMSFIAIFEQICYNVDIVRNTRI